MATRAARSVSTGWPHAPHGAEAARGPACAGRRLPALSAIAEGPLQSGLRRMKSSLGLIPYGAAEKIDHLGLDLLSAMGRQAMEHRDVGRRPPEKLAADDEPAERRAAHLLLALLSHARKDVGADDVSA